MLTELIQNFIEQNDSILDIINHSGRDLSDLDKDIYLYLEVLPQTRFNAALGVDFASVLQLCNDKELIDQFELADIGKLFDSLIKLQAFNLDAYVESAHFEWAIMDNRERAKVIIAEGLIKARQKIEELTKLLGEINND